MKLDALVHSIAQVHATMNELIKSNNALQRSNNDLVKGVKEMKRRNQQLMATIINNHTIVTEKDKV